MASKTSTQPDQVELLNTALLDDLAGMARIAHRLPVGGLPIAGRLAEHGYVVCGILAHHVGTADAPPPGTDRDHLVAAIEEVQCRLGRLYSAERPGGLDHIDAHLTRLYEAVRPFLRDAGRPRPASSWWAGLDSRRRARFVAWFAVATGDAARPLVAVQPWKIRLLLRLGYRRRAATRAALLGLARN